jgi:hypothetical protein
MIANLPVVVKGVPMQRHIVSFLSLGVLAAHVAACGPDEGARESASVEGDVAPVLAAHTAEFERRVYRVTDGVHVAVGFGLANSILVEGESCAFVVDVLASREKGEEVRAEFERITSKPIEALVYTHNHADHVFGGRGFVPEGPVDVYAHETTSFYIDRLVSVLRPIIAARSERMFGNQLPASGPDRFVNAGIGPALELAHGEGTVTLIRPNRTFADRLSSEICGVAVERSAARRTGTCSTGCAASTPCGPSARSTWCRATRGPSRGGKRWQRSSRPIATPSSTSTTRRCAA